MRQMLAVTILGGILAFGASAALADDNADRALPSYATATTMQGENHRMVSISNDGGSQPYLPAFHEPEQAR